jgi:hypothetical protein
LRRKKDAKQRGVHVEYRPGRPHTRPYALRLATVRLASVASKWHGRDVLTSLDPMASSRRELPPPTVEVTILARVSLLSPERRWRDGVFAATRGGAGIVRLVLVIEQINGALPTARVELIRNGDEVIATATASAFDDPVFQLQEATRAIGESYPRKAPQ